MKRQVVVTGSFDDLRSRHVRLLQEAARLGDVHVYVWSDETTRLLDGAPPKFPDGERAYLIDAIRFVSQVTVVTGGQERDALPLSGERRPDIWVVDSKADSAARRAFCAAHGIGYQVLGDDQLSGFPALEAAPEAQPPRKKVIVTGCYDWLHSGHIRFFEEVSGLGDLYVALGNDANVKLLKGEGHPMFAQDERCYMVQAVRHVHRALISSGFGWLDAEPEMRILKPDIYAVNEDGDKPEKRAYCQAQGIEYVVLKRTPKEGLPRRQSTALRGF
jgi:cytidyltransferase-like protein